MIWTKIEDKLPPVDKWVLWLDGNNTMCKDQQHYVDKMDHRHECLVNYLHNYTHWMHLPELK